ncbi:Uncharacterized protein CC_3748 [hydrothermal vent metagenome]|uniref:Uncharacterized protein CC_3748 n=1 Tax=hydrothermal vent metagenome TaxID=652676 RepID=A0A3B0RYC5_9ZZZZ
MENLVKTFFRIGIIGLILSSLTLAGCSTVRSAGRAVSPFGKKSTIQPAGIGVNSFLWRASLETLNFLPLQSADPYGGVIITDWHSDEAARNERFKATVYILDTRLRADGLKVVVFKEVVGENGGWVSANVDPDTGIQIENSILSRARELKIRTLK